MNVFRFVRPLIVLICVFLLSASMGLAEKAMFVGIAYGSSAAIYSID